MRISDWSSDVCSSDLTCVCSNRILVQDGIYDAFARQFATVVQELSIGSGVTEGIAIGPLIDARALEKVDRIVLDAIRQGARVLAGGHRHPMGGKDRKSVV